MPGAIAPPSPQMSSQGLGGVSGLGAAQSGYGAAQQNLAKSLQASGNTTSSQEMQLGQQLQQNQGNVQQSLANRGLGNTTISNTMQQVPQQTYNMGMAQVQNQGALRQMQGYQNLANTQLQGGMGLSQMQQPYAQQNAINQQVQAHQPGPQSAFNQANAGNQTANQYQNLMNAQNWQQNGYQPGQTGFGAPGNANQGVAPQPQGTPNAANPGNPFAGMDPLMAQQVGGSAFTGDTGGSF